MHCHTTASSELVICPGCGRELREAPPKVLTYGTPVLLALVLILLLVTQWHRISPVAWARANLVRGVGIVEELSSSIEPEMVIVMTPIVEGTDNHGTGNNNNGNNNNGNLVLSAANDAVAIAPAVSLVTSDTQAIAMADVSVARPTLQVDK